MGLEVRRADARASEVAAPQRQRALTPQAVASREEKAEKRSPAAVLRVVRQPVEAEPVSAAGQDALVIGLERQALAAPPVSRGRRPAPRAGPRRPVRFGQGGASARQPFAAARKVPARVFSAFGRTPSGGAARQLAAPRCPGRSA